MLKRTLGVVVVLAVIGGSGNGQGWTPLFTLQPLAAGAAVGSTITVDVAVFGVGATVGGWQVEILFPPGRVQAVSLTPGPYLAFNTFLGYPAAFPDKVRIGSLAFPPGPYSLPPGSGSGVLAHATFLVLQAGPIHLDLTPFCIIALAGGSASVPGTHQDAVVQGLGPGDVLGVSGVPNPGGSLSLTLSNPALAGLPAITAASLGNCCIPLPGAPSIPLAWDGLVDLALLNTWPYSNSILTLDASGTGVTGLQIPGIAGLTGLRVYFASIAVAPAGLVVSNGTWADILVP